MISNELIFDSTVFLIHAGYIAVAIGVFQKEPSYLSVIDYWTKVFIGIFLLWRFNSFAPAKFTEFDRKVVFSAGMFMFVTTIVNTYLLSYVKKAKELGKFAYGRVKTEFARGNPEEQK
uniref:Uncharacterized protein n=1 Tax=viral metagenome TaxID=1070528 RepID=A0A6C0CGP9_9ZZZZ